MYAMPGAITGSTDTAAYFTRTNSANAYVGTPLQLNNMLNVTMLGWIRRETNQANRTGLFGQNDLVEFGYIDNNTIQAQSTISTRQSTSPRILYQMNSGAGRPGLNLVWRQFLSMVRLRHGNAAQFELRFQRLSL